MLSKNMTLKQMLDYKPTDSDMESLDLNIIVYIKALFIANDQISNIKSLKHIIENSEASSIFINIESTPYYEFKSKDNKCLIITELFSKVSYAELESFLKEILDKWQSNSIYSLNIYTHDNKYYVMDNIGGYNNIEKVI